MENPFSDFGSIVSLSRFVGRNDEINQIQQRLLGDAFGNIAIIGLPRIGKSSLAWNSVYILKAELAKKRILPIWIPLGEFSSLFELFDEILENSTEFLTGFNLPNIDIYKSLQKAFTSAQTAVEKKRFIKKFLRLIRSNSFRLILILDEFDNAQSIFNLQDFQFLREASYNLETKIGILTVSRKTVQELEPDNGALSNFYQIFTDLRLGLFANKDLLLYWERIEKLGVQSSSEYILNVQNYAGNHPYLLDAINHQIFNNIKDKETDLNSLFANVVEELKLKIYNEYESILKLIEFEGLASKLFQMIVGPVYDITQRDVERLLKYNIVSLKDNNYEVFANYFREYLNLKSSEIDIWPLWGEVEKEVRMVIKFRLFEKYGENWETGFIKEYGDRRKELMTNLNNLRAKNQKAFKDKYSVHLIDYTYPMDMFEGFMVSDWKWFGAILGKTSADWKIKFEFLGKIRNPLAHNNSNFLSSSDKNIAMGYCQEILSLIKAWDSKSK